MWIAPHLHESVNQPLTGLTAATVFLGYRQTACDKTLYVLERHQYYAETTFIRCHHAETVTKVPLFHENKPAHKSFVAQQALSNC